MNPIERLEKKYEGDVKKIRFDKQIAAGLIRNSNAARELKAQKVTWYSIPNGVVFMASEEECVRPANISLGGVELVECAAVVWGEKDEVEQAVTEVYEGLSQNGLWQEGMTVAAYDIRSLLAWLQGQEINNEEEDWKQPETAEIMMEYNEALDELKSEVFEFLYGSPGELAARVEWIDGANNYLLTKGSDVLLLQNGSKEGRGTLNTQNEGKGLVFYGGGFGEVDGLEDLEPIGNVAGLVFFREGMSQRERKTHIRKVQARVRRWLNNPQAQMLGVTSGLLEAWQAKGRAVVPEEEVLQYLSGADEVEKIDHGFYIPGATSVEVSLLNYEPKASVGGTKLFLRVKEGNLNRVVTLDFGWDFGTDPYVSSMGGRPPWRAGLDPYLRRGLFPRVTRLYRSDVLLASLSPQIFNKKDETSMFILGELYHRFGAEGLKEMAKTRLRLFSREINWRSWDKALADYKKEHYSEKSIYVAAIISHAHQDHAAGLSFIRPEVPAVMSPWTWMILMADYATGWHWTTQETIIQKDRSKPPIKGNQLETEERPVTIMHDGEVVQLTTNIRLYGWKAPHSIPGEMPTLTQVLDQWGNVIASFGYPGDYRYDPHFFEEIGKIGVHTLFVEGTNIPGSKKLSAALTEQDVAENIAEVVEGCDSRYGLAMVRLVKGNIERLNNLIGIAGDRQVVVSRKVARLLHMAGVYTVANGGGWWGDVRPPQLDDPRIAIYKGNKSRYYNWEKELMDLPNYQVVDDEIISAYPGDFLLVIDHRDHFESIKIGGPNVREVRFVDSVYWVYDAIAKMEAAYVMNLCDSYGWQYYGDMERGRGGIVRPERGARYHASGHIGNFDDQVDLIRRTGALRLIVGHSEHPEKVAAALARAFPDKQVVQRTRRPWGRWEF